MTSPFIRPADHSSGRALARSSARSAVRSVVAEVVVLAPVAATAALAATRARAPLAGRRPTTAAARARTTATATTVRRTAATTWRRTATAAAALEPTTATTGKAAAAATTATAGEAAATTAKARRIIPWRRPVHAAWPRSWAAAALALDRRVATDAAPVERRPVHRLQRGLPGRVVGVGHEAEAAASSGVPVLDDHGILQIAKGLKRCAQRHIVGRPRQSTNKQLHGVLFLCSFADPSGRVVWSAVHPCHVSSGLVPAAGGGTSCVLRGVMASLESYQ